MNCSKSVEWGRLEESPMGMPEALAMDTPVNTLVGKPDPELVLDRKLLETVPVGQLVELDPGKPACSTC